MNAKVIHINLKLTNTVIKMSRQKVDMIVDLQYGSTGKGLIAGYLAMKNEYDVVVNANMPNAGHTFIDDRGNTMIHKVLPNGVVSPKCKYAMVGPGSVFSVDQLLKEMKQLDEFGYNHFQVVLHARATILQPRHAEAESHMDHIGSTKQGSAAAMIEKIMRGGENTDPTVGRAVATHSLFHMTDEQSIRDVHKYSQRIIIADGIGWRKMLSDAENVLAEGAQGFSLGINERFYPYCTSRDCSPARFMSDMAIPLTMLRKVIGTARTYPIRVGGTSGGWYPDQMETSWEKLELPQELTTVTKKVRRVFTFSPEQIAEAVAMCQPDEVFLNFCNYTPMHHEIVDSINDILKSDIGVPGAKVKYQGFGPTVNNIVEV